MAAPPSTGARPSAPREMTHGDRPAGPPASPCRGSPPGDRSHPPMAAASDRWAGSPDKTSRRPPAPGHRQPGSPPPPGAGPPPPAARRHSPLPPPAASALPSAEGCAPRQQTQRQRQEQHTPSPLHTAPSLSPDRPKPHTPGVSLSMFSVSYFVRNFQTQFDSFDPVLMPKTTNRRPALPGGGAERSSGAYRQRTARRPRKQSGCRAKKIHACGVASASLLLTAHCGSAPYPKRSDRPHRQIPAGRTSPW